MKHRALIFFAVAIAIAAVAAWFWIGEAPRPDRSTGPVRAVASPAPEPTPAIAPPTAAALAASTAPTPVRVESAVAPGQPLVRTTPVPIEKLAAPPPRPTPPPETGPEWQIAVREDLGAIVFMLRDFRSRMGENPVGSNAEIMRAIMGGNEAKAYLGPPPGQRLNENGELIDRWGAPYFFHQLSKTSMEIRSAGPDGRLYTVDDVVVK